MKIFSCFSLVLLLNIATTWAAPGKNNIPLRLRIKNSNSVAISKVIIVNSHGDTVRFGKIKPRKTSAYKKLNSLCNCGYHMEITYSRGGHNELTLKRNCVNIMACNDYYTGDVLLNIKAGKFPEKLVTVYPDDHETELDFKGKTIKGNNK
jgi:hypothetical protein